MSANWLSDDPADWPSDPHTLLGVQRSADVAAIRRNYAALIRVWRPESHPGEFRKIRDAYEAASRLARHWQQAARSDAESESGLQSASRDKHQHAGATNVCSLEEQVAGAWQLAKQRQPQAAYDVLLRLQRENLNDQSVPVRLYWLLKAAPALDPGRDPLEWLAQGLRASMLRGLAMELYGREMECDPNEALSARCEKLLQLPATPAALGQLAARRWRAAGQLGHHRVIQDDLRRLRPILAADDLQWLNTLTAAAEHLAWSADAAVRNEFKACCQEIEQLTHLQTSRAHEFDRLELLRELARSWEDVEPQTHPIYYGRGATARFGPLVPAWWLGQREPLRPLLVEALAQIVTAPSQTLSKLKTLQDDHSVFVAQISDMLLWFAQRQHPEDVPLANSDEVRHLVARWLWPHNGADYSVVRPALLEFCLKVAVAPETVGEIADQLDSFRLHDQTPFSHQVANDLPLRALFAVCRVY